jgi:hypothetical protein
MEMSRCKIFAFIAVISLALGITAAAAEEKEKARQQYSLEYLYSYTVRVDPNFDWIGPAGEGIRYSLYATGGEVTGPKVQGKIRARGQNCAYLRTDGVEIDNIRRTIETEDGAQILMWYIGVSEWGEDGYQKMLQGGKGLPRYIPLRGSVQLQTGHPKYSWLNRLHCLEIGQWDTQKWEAICDVYAVR